MDIESLKAIRQIFKEELAPVNERLDKIEVRLDSVEVRLDNVEENLEKLQKDMFYVKQALIDLAKDFNQMKNHTHTMGKPEFTDKSKVS